MARGHLHLDDAFYRGRADGAFVREIPAEIDDRLLARGRERYDIYCAVCHGAAGYGDGMIVARGFRTPVSFHDDRLAPFRRATYST